MAGMAQLRLQIPWQSWTNYSSNRRASNRVSAVALLDWAKAEAYGAGATTLLVEADPYAADFYRRCGAVDVGLVPSSLFPGRSLPRLKFPLQGHSSR